MDQLGIDKMVVLHMQNDWVADLAKMYPDRFIPFVFMHPLYDNARETLDHYVGNLGFKGVKMSPTGDWPDNADYYPNDERAYPIYERIQELGVPLLYHSGVIFVDPVKPGRSRTKYCLPVYYDDIARDFPNLPLIIAHGGRPFVWDMAMFYRLSNVYIDISWSQLPASLLRPAMELLWPIFGPDRIMWGSDADAGHPYWLTERYELFLQVIRDMGLSGSAIEKAMGENARELLGLEPKTEYRLAFGPENK
jgi:predicted TIM-barrel fold metal-dependent hydrolase